MSFLLLVTLNALTVAALYFLVASGFSLIFGVLRTVNMAHGAYYLAGAYVGWDVAGRSGSWLLGLAAGGVAVAILGVLAQQLLMRRLGSDELRQALLSIGLAIVIGDLLVARYGGDTYQFELPAALAGSTALPVIGTYPTFRLLVIPIALAAGFVLWLILHRTRTGMLIRAGVDDREILAAMGFKVSGVLATVVGLGAALAGVAGVVGGSVLSVSPGEDHRFLLSSLAVVIVGGMGNLAGAAVGALLIGLSEQFGLALAPNYATFFVFMLMVLVLAIRPQGLMGRA
jgi:branched-chain amino acid transport system permease protein